MSKAKKPSDKTQSFDTRGAHEGLLNGLKTIRDSLDESTIERKVEIGSVLWELGDAVKSVLDRIKSDVRVEAVAELKGQSGNTKLDGDDLGEATITIPEASLRVPKGANIDDLKGYKKNSALFALGKTCISGAGSYGHFASTSRGRGDRRADTPKEFVVKASVCPCQ